MKVSLLDFGEMDEEIRFDDAGAAEDGPRCGEKLFIAKRREGRIGVDHARTRTTMLFAPRASAPLEFSLELVLGARSPAARRSQRLAGRYNAFWMCITGTPIRYAKLLST